MNIWELALIAVGLSMDAFAVSICKGLSIKKADLKSMLIVGAYFGIFQAGMPLIGYLCGIQFADLIESVDHWIALGLLAVIGGKMIFESMEKPHCTDRACPTQGSCSDRACPASTEHEKKASLKFSVMLLLALATSIDALAVGVTFAFLKIDIFFAVLLIGCVTFALSAVGVKIGKIFGTKLKSKAELFGGIVLVLMGLKILLTHLEVLTF